VPTLLCRSTSSFLQTSLARFSSGKLPPRRAESIVITMGPVSYFQSRSVAPPQRVPLLLRLFKGVFPDVTNVDFYQKAYNLTVSPS